MAMPVIAPVLILGIGNILLQDEGAGVHVVRKLQHMSLLPEIEIIDGGTLGLDLFHYLEGRKKVILVDTIFLNGMYAQLSGNLPTDNRDRNNSLKFYAPATDYPPLIITEVQPSPSGLLLTEWVEIKNRH